MLNLIGQIVLNSENNHGAPFTTGRVIKCYWDDVTLAIRVYVYESNGTLVQEVTSGPNITFPSGRTRGLITDFNYKFCDSGDLNDFSMDNQGSNSTTNALYVFPYARRDIYTGHWSCNLFVCDISFNVSATAVTEDSGASDGEITVTAFSSAGIPRYSLDQNATYQTANAPIDNFYTFTGLSAGSYTIYAIDENQCKTSLFVIVPEAQPVYNTRWRLEYDDIYSRGASRIDIQERDYSGSITEIKGLEDPFILSWRNEGNRDIFDTIISSEAEINLLSETNFQFIDLFTQDERKYRVIYYRNTGSGFVTRWTGYGIPSLYSEPYYTTFNYGIQFIATDQIADLKDKDFVDDFGNILSTRMSVLDAILVILRKTDINLNVWENVNIFAEGMGSTYLLFSNQSFENSIYPWVNIDNGTIGNDFVWSSGWLVSSSTSSSGAPAISQTRPDIVANWPVGFYNLTVHIALINTSASEVYLAKLYGFDDSDGSGRVDFGTIAVVGNSTDQEHTTSINVTEEKKYIGVGFERQNTTGNHTITVKSIEINSSPIFSQNSALQQAFIDPSVYYNDDGTVQKCDYVLDKLLVSFGARVYQSDNLWRIELIEQKSASGDFRLFNINGVLQSVGNTYELTTIARPEDSDQFFINRTAILSILQSYGKISFNIDLFQDSNLLVGGDFEETDLTEDGVIGWSFDLSSAPGVDIGFIKLAKKNGDSLGALQINFENSSSAGDYVILKTTEFDLDQVAGPTLLFSFDLLVRPTFEEFYSYVDVSIKIGDEYVQPAVLPTSSTTNLLDGEYLRFYIDDVLSWKTFEKKIFSASPRYAIENTLLQGPVVIKIRLDNNPIYQYSSLTELRAIETNASTRYNNNRVRVLDGTNIRFYELEFDATNPSEDSPDLIKPNDYTNLVWRLSKTLSDPGLDFMTEFVLIDNVTLTFDEELPSSVEYSKLINEDINVNLEKDIIHSDALIDVDGVEDTGNIDANILRLTNNYITLNSGVATSKWGRSYVTGVPQPESIEPITDGENRGITGVSWDSIPSVTMPASGASKIWTLEITDIAVGTPYTYQLSFTISGTNPIVMLSTSLKDSSFNFEDNINQNFSSADSYDISVQLTADTNTPVYFEIVFFNLSETDSASITLTDVSVAEDQITGDESLSLLDILMRMYRGQLSTPSYKLTGSFISTSEASFFNTFFVPHINRQFIPTYISIHDKTTILDGELMELKAGESGLPPPDDIYEFTTEHTTEFDA